MRKFLNWKLFLFLIVFLAGFLRFYQLGVVPASLTWDETAWGYNAYSLGINGKDEFGRFLPHDYLESFGDFKPPMYAYLTVLPVKIFGLNEFSTRFPSALFGVLTVLLTYFLVKRIFNNSDEKEKYALWSALFLAISPWHILLSRAAFEANIATFFIVLGVWSFLAAVQDRRWYLVISAFSFAMSMYTFNTARIVTPALVILLTIGFRNNLLKIKKEILVAGVIGVLLFLPTLGFLFSPQAGLRFKEVNIFSDPQVIITANQEIKNDNNAIWSKIIHNRRFLYSLEYVKHYLDNLSPSFLFIKGDGNTKFSTQDVGQMYIWDIVFFISGVLLLLRKKEGKWWLVPLWLLIGIIPAATARETPHALRIETTLPTFQIFVAYAFVNLLDRLYKNKNIITAIVLILLAFNVVYFYHNYFYHYKYEYSQDWQYGYKDSFNYAKLEENKYDHIQVTNALGRPYIYYLFYNKVSPDYLRHNAFITRDSFGFVSVDKIGKYIFPKVFDNSLSKNSKVLYISSVKEMAKGAKILKTFYTLKGDPVLVAYTL